MKTHKQKARAAFDELSAARKLRMIRRAEQIKTGEVEIPYRCAHCSSSSMTFDIDDLDMNPVRRLSENRDHVDAERLDRPHRKARVMTCLACGRKTSVQTAMEDRRQRILAYIREGRR